MDLLQQRLIFALDELWTALAELRSAMLIVAAHDSGTPQAYRDAISSVEKARQHLVDATASMLIVAPEVTNGP